jgi:hypothetical protein
LVNIIFTFSLFAVLHLLAIKLELISSPPGHPLASGVSEASILRAAAEIGAIYVNKKVGDF